MEPLLLAFLEPLGPERAEITHRILEVVENINVGVLGAIGLAEQLKLPAEPIASVLGALEQQGILSQTRDEPPG